MRGPKAVLSHPGRQHSHQTCLALQEGDLLSRFFTVFWHGKSVFKRIEKVMPGSMIKELKKRHYDPLSVRDVRMNYRLFSLEVMSKIFGKTRSNHIEGLFDKWVSSELTDLDHDIFIGYETSSLESFRMSKAMGKTCILDLAATHYSFQKQVYNAAGLDPFNGNVPMSKKINRIKYKELSLADYIFVPTWFAKKSLLDSGIASEKIFIIPYGCNPANIHVHRTYRKSGPFKILYVGHFGKKKGVGYLLRAVKELDLKDAELTCIGRITDGHDIFMQHQGDFRYIPFLHHDELVRYYQDADVFVLPSVLDSFGMVVLEAMSCGTPVIVTENTGAKEVVREGIDGFSVPALQTGKLKERILAFYEDRHRVEEMGRNARARSGQYTWDAYRQRVRDVIYQIMYRPAFSLTEVLNL